VKKTRLEVRLEPLKKKAARVHLAAAASLLVLTGCGGSGGNGSSLANGAPRLVLQNTDQSALVGHEYEYDANQNGSTFSDPDGDALTYSIMSSPALPGLHVDGSRIAGTPIGAGTFSITITASDGRASARDNFSLVIRLNAAPKLIHANGYQFVAAGAAIDYDSTQSGTVFFDDDQDPLTYQVSLLPPAHGLSVDGAHITGVFDSIGVARAQITATDPAGASATDMFGIVAAGREPGEPSLPAQMYAYADAELTMPLRFEVSNGQGAPFWDTTPLDNPITDAGATLGRVLFYDKRLSITNTLACASCHEQAHAFASPTRFSPGFQGELSKRNAMALANVRYNIRDDYFSDMRAHTLESLVLMPIQDPIELGQPLSLLEAKLAGTDFYQPLFLAAFGTTEITSERIARALAQFLRSLVSYRSKYDKAFLDWSNGEPKPSAVLTPEEYAGSGLFNAFCSPCHRSDVQTMETPSNNGLDEVITDPGVLGSPPGNFRAASLRNIAVSGPYMHDGRFGSIREVIDHYDSGIRISPSVSGFFVDRLPDGTLVPRRLNLTDEEKSELEAFLNTLTDEEFLNDPKFADPFQ
jgi:cytochrome c peroxidase